MRKLLLTALILLMPVAALAEFNLNSNRGLQENCKAQTEDSIKESYCIGYLKGVTAAYGLSQLTKPTLSPTFCPPENWKAEEIREVYLKWLDKNPEQLDEGSALIGVITSVSESYECEPVKIEIQK